MPRRPTAIWVLMAVYGFSGMVCLTLGILFFRMPMFLYPMTLLLFGLLFLSALYGIATRKKWVRELGMGLSGSVVIFFLLFAHGVYGAIIYWLSHPELDLGFAILISGLALFAANALCPYYLTRPYVKTYLSN